MNPIDELKQHLGMNLEMGGGMVSPQPWNNAGKPLPYSQRVINATIKPVAKQVLDYGTLVGGAVASTPLSLGSFAARSVGANKMAEGMAQKAIDVRNATGYNKSGTDNFLKGAGTTAKTAGMIYALANAPKAVSMAKDVLFEAPQQVAKVAVSQAPRIAEKVKPISKFLTDNGRDFFLKGRTPTYELGMPTRIFRR